MEAEMEAIKLGLQLTSQVQTSKALILSDAALVVNILQDLLSRAHGLPDTSLRNAKPGSKLYRRSTFCIPIERSIWRLIS